MRTRATPKSKSQKTTTEPIEPEEPTKTLTTDNNPPRLFILPKSVGNDATVVTLAHPRTLNPTRYYCCPDTGFYEFKRTAVGPDSYRSWLLQATRAGQVKQDGEDEQKSLEKTSEDSGTDQNILSTGYALKTPEIFTATEIDPLFLILPALSPVSSASKSEEAKVLFLSCDDLFEKLFEVSRHFREVLENPKTRALLESRMDAISDTVDAGDETMYRLNAKKLLSVLVGKAKRVVSNGFPKSLEERFILKPLEKPMLAVKREAVLVKVTEEKPEDASQVSSAEMNDSQSTTATLASFESQVSVETTITIPDESPGDSIPAALLGLQRLRVALEFIICSYVPPHLMNTLNDILNSPDSPLDFTSLNAYLIEIAAQRKEAAAQRSVNDFSRKRGFEDDEVAMEREEKKRKMEEEEKRKKASESRGVKDLKKADISGMKKMSDFFKKAPAKAK